MSERTAMVRLESPLDKVFTGEFKPTCDPRGRLHTLGNLALAAFDKGKAITLSDGREKFTYILPCAEDFSVELSCTPRQNYDYKELTAVTLEFHGPARDLTIAHSRHRISITSSGVTALDPELEVWASTHASLERTTDKITDIAEAFFDTPPQTLVH